MSLILRGDVGRRLSIPEMDGNFTYLQQLAITGTTSNINTFEVTYSELNSLIETSSLNSGTYYIITDYKTCYDQPDYDINRDAITQSNYKVGNTHSILVFATSETTLSTDAWQPDYPNDRIKYDVSYSTTYTTGGTAFGRISERIDEWNNRTDYDHRDILFKRYRHYYTDLMPLSGTISMIESGTVSGINTQFDVDFSVDDYLFLSDNLGLVFKITQISSSQSMSVTGSYIPNANGVNYHKGYTSSEVNLNGYLQYYQNNVDGSEDYEQFHTFKLASETIINNKFGDFYSLRDWNEHDFDLPNNVFGEDVLNSFFGSSFGNNTFVNDVEETKIGDYCQNNIYYSNGDDFDDNVIGNFFQNNTILSRFDRNSIKNRFENNYIIAVFENNFIGDNFSDNRIHINENNFDTNNIGNNFQTNKIYENFYQNRIFNDFNNNNLYNSFYKNEIGCQFEANTIGISTNIGDSAFFQNKIGNRVKGNLFVGQNYGNEYGENFTGNQLSHSTYANKFGYECTYNSLTGSFINNQIGDYFFYNTINGVNFENNTIGNYFQLNGTISNNFSHNNIGNGFEGNIIGNNFAHNNIGNVFENNTIGNGFGNDGDIRGNKIGNSFTDNIIGDNFVNNRVADLFNGNNIGKYFQLNDVQAYNVNNTNFNQYYGNINSFEPSNIMGLSPSIPGTDGTYTLFPNNTTGIGTASAFTVVVTDSIVTELTLSNTGYFYEFDDSLVIYGEEFGGTNDSNITITVSSLSTAPVVYTETNSTIVKNHSDQIKLYYLDSANGFVQIDVDLPFD